MDAVERHSQQADERMLDVEGRQLFEDMGIIPGSNHANRGDEAREQMQATNETAPAADEQLSALGQLMVRAANVHMPSWQEARGFAGNMRRTIGRNLADARHAWVGVRTARTNAQRNGGAVTNEAIVGAIRGSRQQAHADRIAADGRRAARIEASGHRQTAYAHESTAVRAMNEQLGFAALRNLILRPIGRMSRGVLGATEWMNRYAREFDTEVRSAREVVEGEIATRETLITTGFDNARTAHTRASDAAQRARKPAAKRS